jgi:anaerobic selenocysteine-containing dehydrogenase
LESYPLVLGNGPKSRAFFHTQYRQVSWLRRIHPEPRVRINPETAERHQIKDGDWVWIESPRGKCRQKAYLTQRVHPRMILADTGWWFPERSNPEHGVWESNINLLTGSEAPFDPGMGSTPARSYLCRIYKVEEA